MKTKPEKHKYKMKLVSLVFGLLVSSALGARSESRIIASQSLLLSPISTSGRSHIPKNSISTRGGGQRKKSDKNVVVEKKDGPLQTFVSTVKESRRHLAAAAAARCVSIFSMFPVGTLTNCDNFVTK